ncbi:MAG: tetratricopeptide repeat protein [Methanotrichaceae archaeon]|nr:tetratricopeptide repeat protein [Methanotrichaceae archaeon]
MEIDPQYALNWIENCVIKNPLDADSWSNKAFALYYLGRHEEAVEAYDRVNEIDPDNKIA